MFFCKYNDPIYVKMEKLEIMIKLAGEKNIDQVWDLGRLGHGIGVEPLMVAKLFVQGDARCWLLQVGFALPPPPAFLNQVLLEFKEYAQEVDVDFVRKVGRFFR